MRSEKDMESKPAGFVRIQKVIGSSTLKSGSYRFEMLLTHLLRSFFDGQHLSKIENCRLRFWQKSKV